MSDDIILPPEARLDPRLGKLGGQYVILTCVICGREVRHPLGWYRARLARGVQPKTCSRACGGEYRRRQRDTAQ
jgi:RNase P subunit RPR2